ncbi:MAG TPA: VIT domain-containing protein [Kofleriaceae bacterium]|nr:VIT domain-containing protein [Kofleriaceae bacterium]
MVRPALVLAVLACALPARAAELPGRMGMYAPGGGALPMTASDVTVTVHGPVIEVIVTQSFRNDADQPTEATYIFPLPPDAAVSAMEMKLGATTIRAAIEPRQRAAERYERALAKGAPAALLDQERPDVFTQSVAAIPARGTAEVTLRYDTVAHYTRGQWELALPLVVAPRYVPGSATGRPVTGAGHAPDTDRAPDASHVTPPGSPGAGGATTIHLHFDGEIMDLASPTHALDGTTLVDPHSDHDAIIRWRAKLPEAAFVEADGFAAVVVEAPPAKAQPAAHATILVDKSATTRGDADLVARPLVRALGGSTQEIDIDLTRALQQLHPRDPIVLVTDGLVADDAAAIAAAKKLAVAVHVIGIGPAPNRSLLAAIAAETGGTLRFAVPGDPLEQIARDVLADVASPPLPLAINWGTLGASEVVPATMPRVGAGQAALVLARVRRAATGNARVSGNVFGFTELPAPRALEGQTTNVGPLGRRWARNKLDDLIARGDTRAVAEHALRYGLVSPQTSMVAIGNETIAEGGVKHTVPVPVSVPAGMRWQLVEHATRVDMDKTIQGHRHETEDDEAPRHANKKGATRADESQDTEAGGEGGIDLAPRAPSVDVGETIAESAAISSDRRLRLSAALGGGLHLVNGNADALGGIALRVETGYRTLVGGEASLWLVGGLHGEGSLLATVARRGIARTRLELGGGAGLRITGRAVGPALDLTLRVPFSRTARVFLRYDGALLLHDSTFDGENATSLGVEASF